SPAAAAAASTTRTMTRWRSFVSSALRIRVRIASEPLVSESFFGCWPVKAQAFLPSLVLLDPEILVAAAAIVQHGHDGCLERIEIGRPFLAGGLHRRIRVGQELGKRFLECRAILPDGRRGRRVTLVGALGEKV